jgi:hypothetical protein
MFRKSILVGIASSIIAASALAQSIPGRIIPVVDTVHESYQLYDVEGAMVSDGSIHVTIAASDGSSVFESRYLVTDRGEFIEWQYRGDTTITMSRRLDDNAVRTVRGMTWAAKDIVRTIKLGRASDGEFVAKPDDNYGCDWPFDSLSCTSNGSCCDQHDECYAAFDCDALSWAGLESPLCTACNDAVAACITFGYNNNGQPSGCCAAGNCGDPRPIYSVGSGGSNTGDRGTDVAIAPGGDGGFGGYSSWTPWGTVTYSNGHCMMPGGAVLPCG